MPLFGRQIEPARRLANVPVDAVSVEVEASEIELPGRVAEIGSRIAEQLGRALRIGADVAVLDAVEKVGAKRHEGARHDRSPRGFGYFVGVLVGDAAKILERLEVVSRNAVALGVHPPKLPECQRVTLIGRVFESLDGPDLVPGVVVLDPRPERVPARSECLRGHARRGMSSVERLRRLRRHASQRQSGEKKGATDPHRPAFRARRRDG